MSIHSGKERLMSVLSGRKKSRKTISDSPGKIHEIKDDCKYFPILLQKYCQDRLFTLLPKVYIYLSRDDGQLRQIEHPLSNMNYDANENKLVIYTYTNGEMKIKKTVCKCPHIIDTRMFFALNQTLLNFSSMTTLKLEFCNITADHINILQASLNANNTISELSLVGNPIKQQNYYRLIHCGLKALILRFCEISEMGLRKIAREILNDDAGPATLIHLDLSSNMIFDDGCAYIATILRCDRTLQSISLIDCKITDAGFVTLISSINKFALDFEEIFKRRAIRLRYFMLQKVSNNTGSINKQKNVQKDFILIEEKFNRCPFTNQESFAVEGEVFCMGNHSLISLNISHNNLTISSLDLLLKSVTEQTETFGIEKGLKRVILEGIGQNTSESDDVKYEILDFLSNKNRISRITGSQKGSVSSRRSRSSGVSTASAGFDREERLSLKKI